jgi:hypothetical protein
MWLPAVLVVVESFTLRREWQGVGLLLLLSKAAVKHE